MSHASVDLLRKAYADFARGDLDAYWSAYAGDFAFHVPGHNAVAGTYAGHDAFFGMIGKVMQLSGGQRKDDQSAHVYNIRDGRLAECWEQPRDQISFDDAWGA
jgi:hypothetical protein